MMQVEVLQVLQVEVTLVNSELNTCWWLLMSMPPYSLSNSSSSSLKESSNASHWMFRYSSSVSLETDGDGGHRLMDILIIDH